MKLKATFEKHDLQVGISSEIPFFYQGPEEKYVLADFVSDPKLNFQLRYQRTSGFVELDVTTADMAKVFHPARVRCHTIIIQLPESALEEATEELVSIRDHYLEITKHQAELPAPKEPPLTAARVTGTD